MITAAYRRGFTLIELLVAISIIAMLASIVIASMARARDQAQYAKAAVELRQMTLALQLYYETHGEWPQVNGTVQQHFKDFDTDLYWTALGVLLKPMMGTIPTPPAIAYNYSYWANNNISQPLHIPITDSSLPGNANSQYIHCLVLQKGYVISFAFPQNSFTLDDGGVDPDGIDKVAGLYEVIRPPQIPSYQACLRLNP